MQKTRFNKFQKAILLVINPIISDSWSKRSLILIFLLSGFYITNSLISYLLDNSFNTIVIAIILVVIMEILTRTSLFEDYSKLTLLRLAINNFRIGSTYALILEAFKLGS